MFPISGGIVPSSWLFSNCLKIKNIHSYLFALSNLSTSIRDSFSLRCYCMRDCTVDILFDISIVEGYAFKFSFARTYLCEVKF